MSEHEKYAWGSLAASGLVWLFLAMRLTAGWRMADVSVGQVFWTYVVTVVLMSVAHALIAVLFVARRGGDAGKDERDAVIEARAQRLEGYVVLVGVNLLVLHALATAAFGGGAQSGFDVESLPTLVFVLLSVLFAGHVGKQLATIWFYRA